MKDLLTRSPYPLIQMSHVQFPGAHYAANGFPIVQTGPAQLGVVFKVLPSQPLENSSLRTNVRS